MKVKELIKKLEKMDKEKEAYIKFTLDKNDEVGYPLEIAFVEDILDDCVIYGEYTVTKEDCNFIGQVDLKEAYKKEKEMKDKIEELEKLIKTKSINMSGYEYIPTEEIKKILEENT